MHLTSLFVFCFLSLIGVVCLQRLKSRAIHHRCLLARNLCSAQNGNRDMNVFTRSLSSRCRLDNLLVDCLHMFRVHFFTSSLSSKVGRGLAQWCNLWHLVGNRGESFLSKIDIESAPERTVLPLSWESTSYLKRIEREMKREKKNRYAPSHRVRPLNRARPWQGPYRIVITWHRSRSLAPLRDQSRGIMSFSKMWWWSGICSYTPVQSMEGIKKLSLAVKC